MRVKNQEEFVTQLITWMRSAVQAIHVIAGPQAALAEKLIQQAYETYKSNSGGKGQRAPQVVPRVVTWDAAAGLAPRPTDGARPLGLPGSNLLPKALQMVLDVSRSGPVFDNLGSDACVILRDAHFFLRQAPDALAAFKEAVKANRFWCQKVSESEEVRRSVFLLTNSDVLTEELSGYVKVIELPLPVRAEIEPVLDRLMRGWPDEARAEFAPGTPGRQAVVHALVGLSAVEVEDVMSEAVVRHRGAPAAARLELIRGTIERQKAAVLKRTEALEYVPLEQVLRAPELRGYEALQEWVTTRKAAYGPLAERLNLDRPKGMALTGIPGSGKSVAGRLIAKWLGKPLVMFDISSVFGSLVGESERKMREALGAVTAMENCVLMVDEIDKAMGGAHEAAGDSGVTKRVLGKFLSWLSDKNDDIFVVFTMNRIDQLPPELTRRGRVDEIFFVDLPDAETRVEILKLHLERRGVPTDSYTPDQYQELAAATDQFVGAELEEVVKSARLEAVVRASPGVTPTGVPPIDLMLAVAKKVRPLALSDDTGLDSIRKFSKDRAVSVGKTAPAKGGKKRNGGGTGTRGLDPIDPTLHN